MLVCVPTIMHTGTHFIIEELLKDFKYSSLLHNQVIPDLIPNDDTKCFLHVNDDFHVKNRGDFLSSVTLIVPLRHPHRVLKSFIHRGRELSAYKEQWDNMINLVAPLNPMYLHIDNDIRDEQLALINKTLGKEFHTDWRVIYSAAGTTEMKVDDSVPPKEYIDFYYMAMRCKKNLVS